MWFKNRRAKCRQIQKATEQTSKSAATSSTGSGSGTGGKNCSGQSSTTAPPLKRSSSVTSRCSPPSPTAGRPVNDCKPTTEPVRRQSSPTPTSLHDSYHHHPHHHLGATSGSSYLPAHLSNRGQHSPSPPPRVVFAPVSSTSGRFWKHSASLGDLASDFGGCFAQRAAAAAAAAGYASYGVATGSSGSGVGLSPNGYPASPHAAPYYSSQVHLRSHFLLAVSCQTEISALAMITTIRGLNRLKSTV